MTASPPWDLLQRNQWIKFLSGRARIAASKMVKDRSPWTRLFLQGGGGCHPPRKNAPTASAVGFRCNKSERIDWRMRACTPPTRRCGSGRCAIRTECRRRLRSRPRSAQADELMLADDPHTTINRVAVLAEYVARSVVYGNPAPRTNTENVRAAGGLDRGDTARRHFVHLAVAHHGGLDVLGKCRASPCRGSPMMIRFR